MIDPTITPALSATLRHTRRFEAAHAALIAALERDPESVRAHMQLAFLLLTQGDYRRGFAEYEWRDEGSRNRNRL